jgi:hypothetical protein
MEDQAIVKAIKSDNAQERPTRFRHIAEKLGINLKKGKEYRRLDQALQRLRCQGRIAYHGKHGWTLVL